MNHISAPLLDAIKGETPTRRPVWFMRQAGRSLPEYRALRAGQAMLDACFNADLVTEITLQPVRRLGVDAAILFSDIVVPLRAAGIDIDIKPGVGPVIAEPIVDRYGIEKMPNAVESALAPISDAIGQLRSQLQSFADPVTLIGFAGAPFTLASYLVEGGPSKHHERTKALMYSHPDLWEKLLAKIADITSSFLRMQIEAGVEVVQLFDSWAGALSQADYDRYVVSHSARVLASVSVPTIHFGVGTAHLLSSMAKAGANTVGIDWRTPLTEAFELIGPGYGLQGNLDPALLFASWPAIEQSVRRILAEADAARAQGASGHIFNLGHGVLPETDPAVLAKVVELVHSIPI